MFDQTTEVVHASMNVNLGYLREVCAYESERELIDCVSKAGAFCSYASRNVIFGNLSLHACTVVDVEAWNEVNFSKDFEEFYQSEAVASVGLFSYNFPPCMLTHN